MNCLYILQINSLSVASFANIFSQSISCFLFVCFAYGFLCCVTAYNFVLFIFAFISIALGD